MRKQTVKQFDYSLGEVRQGFLEADGSEAREKSAQVIRNARPDVGGGLSRRDGFMRHATPSTGNDYSSDDPRDVVIRKVTIEPVDGTEFVLIFYDGGVRIYDADGSLETSFTSQPWSDNLWVAPAGADTFIGSRDFMVRVLNYDAGTWSIGVMTYPVGPGGEIYQPYYNSKTRCYCDYTDAGKREFYEIDDDGYITTTDAFPIPAGVVGERIRVHKTEATIGSFIGSGPPYAGVNVTNIVSPPASITLEVGSVAGFSIGDVIVGSDNFFRGFVTGKITYGGANDELNVVPIEGVSGPQSGDFVSSSRERQEVLAAPSASGSNEWTLFWEVPIFSAFYGYPGAGCIMGGRLWLSDIAGAPGLVVASSVRSYNDFKTGLDDDDAIIRVFSGGSERVRHIVDAGDLLILTDKGVWVQDARGGNPITVNNFAPVKVDARGANGVAPVFNADKVVFVNRGGDAILAAVLSGNIYLKWAVIEVSALSSHLVNNPLSLCAAPHNARDEDAAVIYANQDGSAVAIYGNVLDGTVGFFPWTGAVAPELPSHVAILDQEPTSDAGKFLHFTFVGGTLWAMTYRNYDEDGLNGNLYIEEQAEGLRVDYGVVYGGGSATSTWATNFGDFGAVAVYHGDYFDGVFEDHDEARALIAAGESGVDYIVGMPVYPTVVPWPRELIESGRLGMIKARTIRVAVSMRNTTSLYCYTNNTRHEEPAYRAGDDFLAAPPRKTKVRKFPVMGNRDHPSIEIGQDILGPWEIDAITMEVQG